MFFIGVFGIENKEIEIKTLNNIECRVCGSVSNAKVIKRYTYFHFFFIPILKWNETYYIICDRCGSIYSIPKEKGKSCERNENVDITYWDMQEIFTGSINSTNGEKSICRSCNKEVDKSYKYCPYCGQRMR